MVEFYKIILCYLLGAIPVGLIAGKYLLNQDLRAMGSGNIGASNAYRAGGLAFGVAIGVLDALKGVVAVKFIMPEAPQLGMLIAIIGNMFSIFLKGKGAKGNAIYLGANLALSFQWGLAMILLWVGLTKLIKIPAVATAIVLVVSMFFALDFYKALAIILILYKHKKNFVELIGKSKVKESD